MQNAKCAMCARDPLFVLATAFWAFGAAEGTFDPANGFAKAKEALGRQRPRYALVFPLPGELDARVGWEWLRIYSEVDADPLEKAFETLRQGQCATVPVLHDGRLVGLLTLENIGELVMVNSSLRHGGIISKGQ